MLAHHFEQAGDLIKAVDYLIQAGDRARLTDEHSEAVGFYRRAIALLSSTADAEREASVWLKLGLIYSADFKFDEAHQANETAFRLQKEIPQRASLLPDNKRFPLRISIRYDHISLDPGRCEWSHDQSVVQALFSGLVREDSELNIVPEVARSWQVMDGGKRYIFHLRDDWYWTDGTPVTAGDFEWAWKRNLRADLVSETTLFLFDIEGAQDYYRGINKDPNTIGVKAIDAHTLEVRLIEPVAYFPFILALPVAFPLPAKTIESAGGEWWMPDHIVSNGPYRLLKFGLKDGGVMERNPAYPGTFKRGVTRVEWKVFPKIDELLQAYQDNFYDIALVNVKSCIPDSVPQEEIFKEYGLGTYFWILNPSIPPFNDRRLRVALASSVDRKILLEKFEVPVSNGGLVPPGMPGHSPGIGIPFDLAKARELLAEVGYPGGKGFPKVRAVCPKGRIEVYTDLTRQWKDNLGIEIIFEGYPPIDIGSWVDECKNLQLVVNGWMADYPDPDDFLRRSTGISMLQAMGWHDAEFNQLVERAARTSDRTKRMAMYRQADRKLVVQDALVLVLSYNSGLLAQLIKPWVRNYNKNPMGSVDLNGICMADH